MEKNSVGTFIKPFFKFKCFLVCVILLCGVCVEAKTFNLFLLTGQSNSLGAIKGNFADEKKMRPPPSTVLFWHGNFGSYCSGPDSTTWARVVPQQESQLVMGPEYGFARSLEKSSARKRGLKTEDCGILKVSRDGGGNSHWVAPNGEAFREILSVAGKALAALPSLGYDTVELQAILYFQGESDSGTEIQEAGTRLVEFRKNLSRELALIKIPGIKKIFTQRVVLLVGEPANWHGNDKKAADGSTTVENLRKLARKTPRTAWIETRDLPKIKTGDAMGVHYDGNAQLVIGKRFGDAFADFKN